MTDLDVFSVHAFRRLLRTARSRGYRLARFDEPRAGAPTLYVRHDVDISPGSARTLGEAAAEEGATTNFFFLLNGETYDVFSDETLATSVGLRAAGHATASTSTSECSATTMPA